MDSLFSELSGMLAIVEPTRALSPVEAKAKEILDRWMSSSSPSPTFQGKRRRQYRIMPGQDDVGEEDDDFAACSTVAYGISPLSAYEVDYNGFVFPTMMHAFQAQKANSKGGQLKYTTCTLSEAANMGRVEVIDIQEWDANKDELMLDIMRTFMGQHEHARRAIEHNDLATLKETAMVDNYWPSRIPDMWRELKKELAELA